jgi:hypothetical protein
VLLIIGITAMQCVTLHLGRHTEQGLKGTEFLLFTCALSMGFIALPCITCCFLVEFREGCGREGTGEGWGLLDPWSDRL